MPRRSTCLILTLTTVLSGCRGHHENLQLASASTQLPADGREHRVAVFTSAYWSDASVTGMQPSALHIEKIDGDRAALYVRTPVSPGNLMLVLHDRGIRVSLPISLTPDDNPTADGTPDLMRLHSAEDRRAFRSWFTELADRAADISPKQLPPEVTDCASLLRYGYREALRLHDDRWYAQFPAGFMPSLASVQQWTYPNTPLGAALFRTRPGPFQPSDLKDGTFTEFADAKTLHYDNAYLLGRDLRLARPGDLIFYRVLETNSQYHSMIITGERGEWVVYNTGPDHGHHGEMRRVLLSDLLHHPDPQWRPEPANPNWLGVYRWNILRED